jgi:UDP-N-acetylglucosamine--N-acetylmuramyl-(pentapeptide) pyrophosphoryl-undecaprenol N-acetylglucosamine transferase
MKVLIAAGGTGGHLYPGISVARTLREQGQQVLMVIGQKPLEKDLVTAQKLEFRTIAGVGLKNNVFGLTKFGYNLLKGVIQARKVIKEYQPDVILALGNYLSLSAGLAGYLSGIPLVLHEQNCLPGKANQLLARFAKRICVSFPESSGYLPRFKDKITVTGNPLRQEILRSRPASRDIKDRAALLIFGGSQGAHSINLAMMESLDMLEGIRRNIKLIHLTGKADQEMVEKGYREKNFEAAIYSYQNDMQDIYKQADLAVCRSGALTLAELSYCGLPSILIPYPHAAEDHQLINARVFAQAGAARIIEQSALTGTRLAEELNSLLRDREGLRVMGQKAASLARPDAANAIVKVIRSIHV